MLHRTAKLTPFGRRLLVERVLIEGLAGLEDRSARPRRTPRALAERDVRRILRLRRRLRVGPHRLGPLLGHPRSTVYGVLRRHGGSRLAHADRLSGAPLRYVRERPGELLHVDVKKLGRVPDGGGHRLLGPSARRERGLGYDYLHVAIDDATRVAFVGVHPDERAATTVRFMRDAVAFFADHGVQVERVMTDNAMTYIRSRLLATPSPSSASATCVPARGDPRPMARPSASSERCSASGPTPASSARMPSAWPHCLAGSTPTIDGVRSRTASGSRRSPSAVEPVMSAKSTVTGFRTTRPTAARARGAPHVLQNRAPLGFGLVHCGHRLTFGVYGTDMDAPPHQGC